MGKYKKQIIIGIIISLMIMVTIPTLLRPQPAGAFLGVGDLTTIMANIPEMIWQAIQEGVEIATTVTFKNMLSNYANDLAYNYAVKLATGQPGQKPAFFDMGVVLQSAADQAWGSFATELLTSTAGSGHCQTVQYIECTADPQCPMVAMLVPGSQLAKMEGTTHVMVPDQETFDIWTMNNQIQGDVRRDKCQLETNALFGGIDICNIAIPEPAIEVIIKNIGVGFGEPPPPRCTFSEIKQNFEDMRNIDTSNLIKVSETFNSRSNSLGIIQHLTSESLAKRSASVEQKGLEVTANSGYIAPQTPVTKTTKSPASLAEAAAEETFIKNPLENVGTFTGNIVADAIGTFVNTLASKMLSQIFDKGLNPATDGGGRSFGGGGGLSSGSLSGVAAARLKFAEIKKLTDLKTRERDPSTQLQQLTTGCDVQVNQSSGAGAVSLDALRETNNCVIDESFSLAIVQGLTVGEAINYRNDPGKQILISPNKDFGAHADGSGSTALSGLGCNGCDPEVISLRSIMILQKYGIVPVGWELAARYIIEVLQPSGTMDTYSLRELMDSYGDPKSPFYRLVDPDWQLKAPPSIKEMRGPGERIVVSYPVPLGDTNGDGQVNELDKKGQAIQRGQEASDEQTCIYENDDGTCAYWGYCTEQKPIWRIAGTDCNESFSTCQTFTNAGNKLLVNYLTKTTDRSVCKAENTGCRRYALNNDITLDNPSGEWLINDEPADNIFASRAAAECDSSAAGCSQFLRLTDIRGNSLPAFDDDPDINTVSEIIGQVVADEGDINFYSTYAITRELYIGGGRIDCRGTEDYDGDGAIDEDANVSCMLYTPRSYNGPDIPGVVTPATLDEDGIITDYNDECPAECVGYQPYEESARPTLYPASWFFNFIPETARQCSAQANGCTEFTNLNEVALGGEGLEYYSQLRQCVTEDDSSLVVFFTWEGSDESGFQLVSWRLVGGGPGDGPIHSSNSDYDLCTAAIYGLAPEDPAANPDCREFIDDELNRFYRLASRVIPGTEECQPLRRTLTDINYDGIIDDEDCEAGGGVWDANGCTHLGLPSDSLSCGANVAGCRLYQGFGSGNTEILLNSVFESGTLDGWTEPPINSNSLHLVNYSVILGGHSINVDTTSQPFQYMEHVIDGIERQNYILTFWAAGNINTTLLARLEDENSNILPFAGSASLQPGWRAYTLGPVAIDNYPIGEVRLIISGWQGHDNYIDNIKLTESNDLFLVSGSWETPAICEGPPSQLYCEEYRDGNRKQKYIKNFTRLCKDEFIGCEALVNTFNSDTAEEVIYTGNHINPPFPEDPLDDITVPADAVAYIVNDQEEYCKETDKACTELGLRSVNIDGEIGVSTQYRFIDPEQFFTSLCTIEAEFCEEFLSSGGSGGFPLHFKDPQDRVCVYRSNVVVPPQNDVKSGWFKRGVNPITAADVCQIGDQPSNEDTAPVCNFNYDENYFWDPFSIPLEFNYEYYNGWMQDPWTSNIGCYTYGCDSTLSSCSEFQDPTSPEKCDKQLRPGEGRCDGESDLCRDDGDCLSNNCLKPSDGGHCKGDPGDTPCFMDSDCDAGEFCIEVVACDYYYELKDTLDAGIAECRSQVDPGIGCVGFYETDRGENSKYLRADCQANCGLVLGCYNTGTNKFTSVPYTPCVSDEGCDVINNEECRGVPVEAYPSCIPDENLNNPDSKPGCVY